MHKDDFETEIKRSRNFLLKKAYGLTYNWDLAEDILQESIYKAYKKREDFDPEKSSFNSWLIRIIHNTSVSYSRRLASKEKTINSDLIPSDSTFLMRENRFESPDTSILSAELAATITQVYHSGNDSTQKKISVLLANVVYGVGHIAIAKELGVTEDTSKSYAHRARQILKHPLIAAGFGPRS